MHHLLGLTEIALMLGVSRQRVDQLRSSYGDFPPPEAELAAGRIWSREAIEGWLALHPERKPGRQLNGAIMFDRLTERARMVFVLAQQEARGNGHGYVGCEHLVVGLVGESEGIAAHALNACGLTIESARAALGRVLGRGSAATLALLPLTPRVRRALEEAQKSAIEVGHTSVGTEHLLLGILREGENVGCRLLQEAGLDLSAVRLNVLQQMGFPQPQPAPGRDRQLSRVLERVTDHLHDIDARLERLEQQLS